MLDPSPEATRTETQALGKAEPETQAIAAPPDPVRAPAFVNFAARLCLFVSANLSLTPSACYFYLPLCIPSAWTCTRRWLPRCDRTFLFKNQVYTSPEASKWIQRKYEVTSGQAPPRDCCLGSTKGQRRPNYLVESW